MMPLTAPKVSETQLEESSLALWAEFLARFFTGANHEVGGNPTVAFPKATIRFNQSALPQPLQNNDNSLAISCVWVGAVGTPRLEWDTVDGATQQVAYVKGAWLFYIRSNVTTDASRATQPHVGNADKQCQAASDRLFTLLQNSRSALPLAQKGILRLRPMPHTPVTETGWIMRALRCTGTLKYNVLSQDHRPLAPACVIELVGRRPTGFDLSWDADAGVIYEAFYRRVGDTSWTSVGIVTPDAEVNPPEALSHAFELKVTARGDVGSAYNDVTQIDSNIVTTPNDSLLANPPLPTGLVGHSLLLAVRLTWTPVDNGTVLAAQIKPVAAGSYDPAEFDTPPTDGTKDFSDLEVGEYNMRLRAIGKPDQNTITVDPNRATATSAVSADATAFYPVEGLSASGSSPQVVSWSAPASGSPIGYRVYANYQEAVPTELIAELGPTEFSFDYSATGGHSVGRTGQGIGVSAVYEDGESEVLVATFSGCYALVPRIVSMEVAGAGLVRFFLGYGEFEGSGQPRPVVKFQVAWDEDPDGAFSNTHDDLSNVNVDYDFTASTGNGDFYFKVRAFDAGGCVSEWSELFQFTVN